MGRAARLKSNPDRERYQRERVDRECRKLRQQKKDRGGSYASSQTFEHATKAAAMHEAGHVVAAFALGFGVTYSVVNATRGQEGGKAGHHVSGYTQVMLPWGGNGKAETLRLAHTPEALRIRAVQAAAGAIAESIVTQDVEEIARGAGGDDDDIIQYALASLPPDTAISDEHQAYVDEYFDARQTEARELLDAHIDAEIRIANHLLANLNREVPGDELQALMENDQQLPPLDAVLKSWDCWTPEMHRSFLAFWTTELRANPEGVRECGRHSGIPECCIEYLVTSGVNPDTDTGAYVRCPACCESGRDPVKTKACPSGCRFSNAALITRWWQQQQQQRKTAA